MTAPKTSTARPSELWRHKFRCDCWRTFVGPVRKTGIFCFGQHGPPSMIWPIHPLCQCPEGGRDD